MADKKYICLYEGAFEDFECDDLIKRFSNTSATHDVVEGHRDFRVVNTHQSKEFEDVYPDLVGRFTRILSQYCEDCGIDIYQFPETLEFEDFRMKKYDKGVGQFSPHVDVNGLHDNKRFLAFFLYLNDVAEGGETTFLNTGEKIKPRKGNVLIFPPTWTYPHAGEVPLSDDKYIIGGYLHYSE